ncbi:hypothetical protein PHLGIDRAFT_507957 [Phlebiopsis gigantea 11061_1 CR5-6]|uniref:Uncharacterized protein n=1 Tax=Phlebiopsis gigantea (strain 11061_1 CR5-6) TaxID=745531 RepID=A0A0C3P2N2_PHLG1|nr:hypothetical protein PHLGIDRAFT_507957 [Phlebiopsis gigantea 11061_1 CR5-6]
MSATHSTSGPRRGFASRGWNDNSRPSSRQSVSSDETLVGDDNAVKRLCIGVSCVSEGETKIFYWALFVCNDPSEPATFYFLNCANGKYFLDSSTVPPSEHPNIKLYIPLPSQLTNSQLREFVAKQGPKPGNLAKALERNWSPTHWVCQMVQLLAEDGQVQLFASARQSVAEELWNTIWHRTFVCLCGHVKPDRESEGGAIPRYEFPSRNTSTELQISLEVKLHRYTPPSYLSPGDF